MSGVKNKKQMIRFEDIEFNEPVGSGNYGQVFLATCHRDKVAVKCCKPDKSNCEQFMKEIEIMSNVNHDNVVQYRGYSINNGVIYVVMKYYGAGNLKKFLNDNPNLTSTTKVKMALDIAVGMAWIHSKGIIHRDLKLENLLIGPENSIVICDFGFSDEVLHDMGTSLGMKGSPLYLAPEVITSKAATKKSDIFSYAIIVCAIVLGTSDTLYPGITDPRDLYDRIKGGKRFTLPTHWPHCLKNLIALCWDQDPDKRPTFENIVEYLEVVVIPVIARLESDSNIREAIPTCRYGQEFWAENFPGQNSVAIDKFVELVCGMSISDSLETKTAATPSNIKCILQALLSETRYKSEEQITMEAFGYLLCWFAPFGTDDGVIIFHNSIWEIAQYHWFHGFINSRRVTSLLLDKAAGSFLIRCSNSTPGVFTLTYVTAELSIKNAKIEKSGKQEFFFTLSGILFSGRTLPELVRVMLTTCLPGCTVPKCQGSCNPLFSMVCTGSTLLSGLPEY